MYGCQNTNFYCYGNNTQLNECILQCQSLNSCIGNTLNNNVTLHCDAQFNDGCQCINQQNTEKQCPYIQLFNEIQNSFPKSYTKNYFFLWFTFFLTCK